MGLAALLVLPFLLQIERSSGDPVETEVDSHILLYVPMDGESSAATPGPTEWSARLLNFPPSPFVLGIISNGLLFSDRSYMEIQPLQALNLPNGFSFSTLFVASQGNLSSEIVQLTDAEGNLWSVGLTPSGTLEFRFTDSSPRTQTFGPILGGDLRDNRWHFLAAVHDPASSITRIYLDGISEITAVLEGGTLREIQSLVLGNGPGREPTPPFVLDEVRLQAGALSALEVEKMLETWPASAIVRPEPLSFPGDEEGSGTEGRSFWLTLSPTNSSGDLVRWNQRTGTSQVISDGRFDYGVFCAIGPLSGRGKVAEVTIEASEAEPVEVTVDNCTYAIDNALRNETTGEYLAGADWETSPRVFNRDGAVPAPFIITSPNTLALYNDGGPSPASLHLSWKVLAQPPQIFYSIPANGTNLTVCAGTTNPVECVVQTMDGTMVPTGTVHWDVPSTLGSVTVNDVSLTDGMARTMFVASTNAGSGMMSAEGTGLQDANGAALEDATTNITVNVVKVELRTERATFARDQIFNVQLMVNPPQRTAVTNFLTLSEGFPTTVLGDRGTVQMYDFGVVRGSRTNSLTQALDGTPIDPSRWRIILRPGQTTTNFLAVLNLAQTARIRSTLGGIPACMGETPELVTTNRMRQYAEREDPLNGRVNQFDSLFEGAAALWPDWGYGDGLGNYLFKDSAARYNGELLKALAFRETQMNAQRADVASSPTDIMQVNTDLGQGAAIMNTSGGEYDWNARATRVAFVDPARQTNFYFRVDPNPRNMKAHSIKLLVPMISSLLLSVTSAPGAEDADGVREQAVKIVEKELQDDYRTHQPALHAELQAVHQELGMLASKDVEAARFIVEIKQREKPRELLGINVLTDLIWHAARFCEFKTEGLKKDFPALCKWSGAIGIVYEKSATARLIIDPDPQFSLEMVFYEGGELHYIYGNKVNDYDRPLRWELKDPNGQPVLISRCMLRRTHDDTEDTEIIEYYSISEEGFKHLKSEQRKIPFSKKPTGGK